MFLGNFMDHALNAEGQTYRGFLITKYLPLKELKSALIEAVHEQSGARIIHIANDDPENLFALSFQTFPDCSNGVAHVLEHTVLCGSKKFPVKDPFFAMTRRSLNTYMNALTGQDFTVYPASSQVEKDFYNLLEVYIDAVFYPLLKKVSFLQEGHRLSLTRPEDIHSPLQIQGVVYNEMKGAMSSIDHCLTDYLFKYLTPDLPYAYNSGGDPKEIPSLTYEELIEFHRTFYHPSRCIFFFYGNLPLSKHLDFIEKHALSSVQKESLLPPLGLQPRFHVPAEKEESYPVSADEDLKRKTIIALGFLTAPISNQKDLLALSLLDTLLTDTDVSPLKYALLQSKLCTGVESLFDTEMSESPWVLICKGCEENAREKIVQVVMSTLKKLAAKGFSQDAIDASMHQLEFERTEIGGDSVPFGLTLFFRAILPKQHGADPESALLIHHLFNDLKKDLKNPTYLPNLIHKYFIENSHAVYLTLKPDPLFNQKANEIEKKHLETIQSRLSEKELQDLDLQEKTLAKYQEEVEHQSIECLPKISLNDIPPHAKDYPLSSQAFHSLTLRHHPCFTNQIIYTDLQFDLPRVSFNDLPLLSLFTRFWVNVGCKQRPYQEALEWQQAALGDFSASLSLHVQHDDPSICHPALSLKAKALDRNASALFEILSEYSNSLNFSDTARLKELLLEHVTELQNQLPRDAMGYAIQLASSGFSHPAAIQQQLQGLPYFSFIREQNPASISSLADRLNALQKELLGAPHPAIVVAAHDEEIQLAARHLDAFAKSLPCRNLKPWENQSPKIVVPSQGRIIPAPVAFSVLAFSTVSFNHDDSPALMVATDLFENIVLHKEIREKGGAYGSGATYLPISGHFYFYSYRDPNISRTYHAFQQAIETISQKKFTERELFEAKLGILQDLDAPLPPRLRAITAYNWERANRTYERRDAFRRAILNASAEDVAASVSKHLLSQKDQGVFVSFAGEDLLKKEAKNLSFPFEIKAIYT